MLTITLLAMASLLPPPGPRTLVVFAAASLKEPFSEIAREYERSQPGLMVQLSFAGSQTLAAQIQNGAPADVFASAAAKNLRDVDYERTTHCIFARNRLEIVVRRGLGEVSSVRDLSRVRHLVVAHPSVPVGAYTERFLAKAGKQFGENWKREVGNRVVSHELDVKAVLAKVKLGEADAGIVYASDVASAGGQVRGVSIPKTLNEEAGYPAAVLQGASHAEDGRLFVRYLLSPPAQRALARHGFTTVD